MYRVCFVIALVACAAFAVTNTTMPSYYAVGSNPRELGRSIGMQQKDAFQQLVQADPSLITILRPWMEANKSDYDSFVKVNKEAYPDIFEEICGIADGAGLNESDVILLMLRPEIEAIVEPHPPNDNCFDIICNAEGKNAFVAHNEDWTPAYKPFGFVLHEDMAFTDTKVNAQHITAFTYPASPVGFTFGYNSEGLVTSCNGLNPIPCKVGKLGRYFINRDVLAAKTIDDALDRLRKAAPNAALGFGMSIGRVGSRRLYHAEMAPYDPHDPKGVDSNGYVDIIKINSGDTYLHSNSYTHPYFKGLIHQYTSKSTSARLARAAEMIEPTTREFALEILGDENNTQYPIYRHGDPNDPEELATISTALMDLDDALVYVYGGNPKDWAPVVVMPLYNPENGEAKTWFVLFLASAICAGVLLIAVVVLSCCIICCCCCHCCNGGQKGSVNSAYRRFP